MPFTRLGYSHFQFFFSKTKTFRLSVFLILCLILGGTSQDIVAPKLPLYLTSLFVIGGCLNVVNSTSPIWKLKTLVLLWMTFFMVHFVYLIPLPPNIWTSLNGRDSVLQGFETLSLGLPWLPLSLTPEKTMFSLFDFLPPLAILLLMGTVVTAREFRVALWSLSLFVVFSALLGMMQVSSAGTEFHFYDFTNANSAVGFFSNANHYSVFLLMSIPIIACLADYNRLPNRNSNRGFAFCMIAILAALLGIAISGSLGGYLLIIPIVASTLYIWTSVAKKKQIYLFGVIGSLIAALFFDIFVWKDVHTEISQRFSSIDSSARQVMFENSYEVAKSFFPIGSGPGSFSEVYRLVEQVSRTTIPHSHNEYIELVVEFGMIGLAGLGFTLIWLAKNIFKAVRATGSAHNSAKFMSIAVMTVAAHSIIDFSLRTIAIMTLAVFAVCAVILTNENLGKSET